MRASLTLKANLIIATAVCSSERAERVIEDQKEDDPPLEASDL